MGNKNKNNRGFTLIELLVVIAIIALLSSVALIALVSARQKSRDVKRLGDMTQMNTALELFFATNRGYPSSSAGLPQGVTPSYASTLPKAPTPADGVCDGILHTSDSCTQADGGSYPNGCVNAPANTYYYISSGTPSTINGIEVYPDYAYYFCLGNQTGNFSSGNRVLTPRGVQ